MHTHGNLAITVSVNGHNEKLVMLGETEEYEPLSRAVYYAMRKDQEGK
jgi:thymidine kinase